MKFLLICMMVIFACVKASGEVWVLGHETESCDKACSFVGGECVLKAFDEITHTEASWFAHLISNTLDLNWCDSQKVCQKSYCGSYQVGWTDEAHGYLYPVATGKPSNYTKNLCYYGNGYGTCTSGALSGEYRYCPCSNSTYTLGVPVW